ncbi:MAG: peptidase U32 family protein [Christensenellales bacterium]
MSSIIKPAEILAPAGGKEQLTAAVRCGADAVYLGTKGFNARQNAENFDGAALQGAVSYCHARNVKVYVTVNTLVMDDEKDALIPVIETIAQSGADAVIAQDLSVVKLIQEHCPSILLHASTQMTIHNTEGVKLLEDMGFSRVVLARELSLAEIEKIARATSLALEVFVHGALCMSVSGACYLSSIIGERSGNRGLCAQPCRLDFKAGNREYALSLKDLSVLEKIPELQGIGVHSFKIEGRMKRPEYVAAAVTACRAVVDGKKPELEQLRAVFSRSGFTQGYLEGKRNLDMFGTRTKEDVVAASSVLSALASLYRKEKGRVPVDMALVIQPDFPVQLHVTDGIHTVKAEGHTPQEALKEPITKELAARSLSKTGNTPFIPSGLSVSITGNSMVTAAELNQLRREALDALLEQREEVSPHEFIRMEQPPVMPHKSAKTPKTRLRFETCEQITGWEEAEYIILPVGEIGKNPALIAQMGEKLAGELPALLFPGDEEPLRRQLVHLKEIGLRRVLSDNLGGIGLAKKLGYIIQGGYGLNVMNTVALLEYEKLGMEDITLSFELNLAKSRRLGGGISRGILAYGHLPLMKMRNCPARGEKGCGACQGRPVLTDRRNIRFPLLCFEKKYAVLLNSLPLYMADKDLQGMDFITLYFTIESKQTCREIIESYAKKRPPAGDRTNGLYFRELK